MVGTGPDSRSDGAPMGATVGLAFPASLLSPYARNGGQWSNSATGPETRGSFGACVDFANFAARRPLNQPSQLPNQLSPLSPMARTGRRPRNDIRCPALELLPSGKRMGLLRIRSRYATTLLMASVATLGGCASTRPLTFPTAQELPPLNNWSTRDANAPTAWPRPVNVGFNGVQPQPASATTVNQATLNPSGIVFLAPPIDIREGIEIITSYFDAIIQENDHKLASLVAANASLTRSDGHAGGLIDVWRKRFRDEDCAVLGPDTPFRSDRVRVFRYEDLSASGEPDTMLTTEAPRPAQIAPGDIVYRVRLDRALPVGLSSVGEVMEFVVGGEPGALKIKAVSEHQAAD